MLVGRRLAIGALRSAVDAALAGAGGVVLLEGEAGMGKTALDSDAAASRDSATFRWPISVTRSAHE
jgi:MoxR-like ATPase